MTGLKAIAWDFDGVLNENVVDGRFVWADTFEVDIGMPFASFRSHIVSDDFDSVLTGRVDLRDRVESWTKSVGFAAGPDALLDYWFAKDSLPNPAMLALMQVAAQRGVRQVIATNNDQRRARYIENEMGYGARVERVFASGRMGIRKPDPAYFQQIANWLDLAPDSILLVDDLKRNVDQAAAQGWRSFLFNHDTKEHFRGFLLNQLDMA
jgi:putative hydrolase of the HAD superfamily